MLYSKIIISILLSSMATLAIADTPSKTINEKKLATPITPLRSFTLDDTDYSDLKEFGAAVGDARYVILGEKTHGEGNVFALKTRLVRYLHEELGFEVLAIESGLYEGAKINEQRNAGKPLRELAPGNIFFMYSTTKEVIPLFDYLDEQRKAGKPMALATFDSQHSGKMSQDSLMVDLANYLMRQQSDIPRSIAWRHFAAHSNSLLRMVRTAPPPEEQQRFFIVLDRIEQQLKKNFVLNPTFPNDPNFWLRITASLRSQAKAFWLPEAIPNYNAPRELAMADNMLWLLEKQYPHKKVVIWAHDFHGQKVPLFPGMKGMLNMVREKIPGEHFYHVYFTGHTGEFFDFIDGKIFTIPTPHAQSIEAQLHAGKYKQAFVDLKNASPTATQFARLGVSDYNTYFGKSGYYSNGKPTLGEYVDGVFYFDVITPATRVTSQ